MEAVLQVLDGEVPSSLRKCFTEVSLFTHTSVIPQLHVKPHINSLPLLFLIVCEHVYSKVCPR
uniref:Uncharacterized protein n=1 Tax=Sphaeramia orbicularis TaxID=375764 RepID=A0A673BBK3_9TELE